MGAGWLRQVAAVKLLVSGAGLTLGVCLSKTPRGLLPNTLVTEIDFGPTLVHLSSPARGRASSQETLFGVSLTHGVCPNPTARGLLSRVSSQGNAPRD